MNQTTDAKKGYLDAFAAAAEQLPGHAVPWVREIRERALSRFSEIGFPTIQDEEWKYTNVSPIERHGFTPAPKGVNGVSAAQIEGLTFKDLLAHRLVFINGYYHPELSCIGALPAGVVVGSLAASLANQPDALQPHLGRHTPDAMHGFAALNTAFLIDGAYIHLAQGVAVDQPIHLIFLSTEKSASRMAQPRNLVVAGEGSQATVIEHYIALGETRYFTNALTEVVTARNAVLEHYRVQQEGAKAYHIGGLHVHMERDSRFTSHAIDLGGLLVRNDVRSILAAEGAECTLNGLYVVGGRQHVDNHTYVDHAKPHGTSREYYKGVLDGRARAVFNGRVVVQPDAQHTDAQQINKNLLLSEDAEVDTKPQLEIYADDVKCSHGATVGQLDPEALFYLRSRAIDEAAARDLLTYAFANDVLNRIRLAPIRLQLEQRLTARLLRGRAIQERELI